MLRQSQISVIVLSLFFASPVYLFSQTVIEGKITDNHKEQLPGINIMVFIPGQSSISDFAISDQNGNYKVTSNVKSDSLIIKFSSINHKDSQHLTKNTSQRLDIVLEEDTKTLEGITVLASPIKKYGDTLSYLVQSFRNKSDRTLEDVLQRLPGIEIEENGQVLYQGLPINKFYIEGLDLMDGRYSMVTKNLPHESVSVVEVIENHQPLKLLEGEIPSTQAAINIKIKNGVSVTGRGSASVGLSPFLWDVNFTPMMFSKNFQAIGSVQSNNIGYDLRNQSRVLTSNIEFAEVSDLNSRYFLLGLYEPSTPDIDEKLFLDHSAFLTNLNGLSRISKDFFLRTNIFFVRDKVQKEASIIRSVLLPNDTLNFFEATNITHDSRDLTLMLTLNKNTPKSYFDNSLSVSLIDQDGEGALNQTTNEVIKQSINSNRASVSNNFHSLFKLGKKIIDFKSTVIYENIPETIKVSPGQFEELLNDSIQYSNLNQDLVRSKILTTNSVSVIFNKGIFRLKPSAGLDWYRQNLTSSISLVGKDFIKDSLQGTSNDLANRMLDSHLGAEIFYTLPKLTLSAVLNLSNQDYSIQDVEKGVRLTNNDFFFDKKFSINYKISSFTKSITSVQFKNKFAEINDFYSSYMLTNVRSLTTKDLNISKLNYQTFFQRLEYKNQISSVFGSLHYLFAIVSSDNSTTYILKEDGTTIAYRKSQPQKIYSHNVSAHASKFINATKTSLGFRVALSRQNGTISLNNITADFSNTIMVFKPEFSVRITPLINVQYDLNIEKHITSINKKQKDELLVSRHKINSFFFITKSQLISCSAEYYFHNSKSTCVADVMYRYTFENQKIDLELKLSNIFNASSYSTMRADYFSTSETIYRLRPRQILLSLKLNV
jgi:hypothetical protein